MIVEPGDRRNRGNSAIRTSVAFRRPASVCPTRRESSSVANPSSWKAGKQRGQSKLTPSVDVTPLTLARGMIARKDAIIDLASVSVSKLLL